MYKNTIIIIFIVILIFIICGTFYKQKNIQQGGHTPLTTIDKTELLKAMKLVDTIFTKHNIPYIIAFGTLLGALRHKGFIPWDDDIDLFIFRKDIPYIEEALKEIEKYYKIEKTWKLIKIYPTDNTYIDLFSIDIDDNGKVKRCRFDIKSENCTEVDMTWWTKYFGFDKKQLLPLKLYEFEDLKLFGPSDGLDLIKLWYGDDCMTVCESRFYDNSYYWDKPKKIPCTELMAKYKPDATKNDTLN